MEILQAGIYPGSADHYLWCTPDTVSWGTLPTATTEPVLTLDSGETVTFDTVSQEGLMEDQGRDPVAYFRQYGVHRSKVLADAIELAASDLRKPTAPKAPHVVLGPVHVRGAQPGDWLRVDFLEMTPRVPYGVISSRHQRGALPEILPRDVDGSIPAVFSKFCPLDDTADRARFEFSGGAATIDMRPFMGLCGVTPAGNEPLSTIPPGPFGGNMDVREMVVGTSLYLPIQVHGAGFYLGDPHFAQGNGEIALTALEGSLRVTARLTVVKTLSQPRAAMPFVDTDDHWIILGMNESLDEAMRQCAELSVDFLASYTGMTPSEAYLYLSAAGDFSVTQVVDLVQGVHCSIRKKDFRSLDRP
ncbi:acetamidase/formamidase family protein [Rhodococcus qingshengii]|uniref:acetamidase/formamidase family protein n=1 Tax=Rhodococcus erythropolis group TaxID=2840174 RepID=UPI001AE85DD8|nr:acetamidase/formamidase family protein [Rhodococcus qingshengii]MBP1054584.1 acetamidase/formamidase family protein [Rhodococcus qingshengii]